MSDQPRSDNPRPDTGPAQEWVLARDGDGMESPRELNPSAKYLLVTRTFAFVDMSGFTVLTRERGPTVAAELLSVFRRETRLTASLRGVRLSKWMGDGAMLVSPDPGRIIATAAHLLHHFNRARTAIRVGLASGEALLFEGDDYIGEPVNLAFRLCEAAQPGEILADVDESALPKWVELRSKTAHNLHGFGEVGGILSLQPNSNLF